MPALPVKLNESAINAMLHGPSGLVWRRIDDVGRAVQTRAQELAPSGKTGRLKSSIVRRMYLDGARVVCRIYSTAPQAAYLSYGTGIYGPSGRMIVPTSKPFLAWEGDAGWIYARKVRGTPPNPFFLLALREVSPWPMISYRSM